MAEDKQNKIKIDLSQGVFEAEGDKQFIEDYLVKFKELLNKKEVPPIIEKNSQVVDHSEGGTKKRTIKTSALPSFVNDLNLRPKDKQSLKDFYNEKSPRTYIENNAVFVYYLQKVLSLTGINIDHIYTCYKEINSRNPENLRQSIIDTGASSRSYGYINTKNMQDIKITARGENLVEHDLRERNKV